MGVVVIGASSGGPTALRSLLSALPADFPDPIVVVMHIGSRPSMLPLLLNESGKLRAEHAENGDVLMPGRIYVAPPDQHLLISDGKLELDHGPRENYTRPAIDPLFRSAARVFGPAATGIILTGELNDGTVGLYEIKKAGGIAIVQDPDDAESPGMPRSAARNVHADYCLPLSKIPDVLVQLANGGRQPKRGREVGGEMTMMNHEQPLARPTAQICPECGGAMSEQVVGKLTQFRCHIGHVMSAEVLEVAQRGELEQSLNTALRLLSERIELCRQMANKCGLMGDAQGKDGWTEAAKESEMRIDMLRELAEIEWSQPDGS
jgi:two-component system chemotaxis response regulator CheB